MPYTEIDHFIAKMRFRAAYPHLTAGSRVCDLGCGLEMAFLEFAEDKIARGVGVDDIDLCLGRFEVAKVGSERRFELLGDDLELGFV